MHLYEQWQQRAYQDNRINQKFWKEYLPAEQTIYESLLKSKQNRVDGILSELSHHFGVSNLYMIGFLDGMQDVMDKKLELSKLTEKSRVQFTFDFQQLFKKMVEYKAKHLYTLKQWDNLMDETTQKQLIQEIKLAKTVRLDKKIGRNDPCPCQSGKKYKKCCGA